MDYIENWIEALLVDYGIADEVAIYWRLGIMLAVMGLISFSAYLVTKKIIVYYIYKFVKQSEATWDDVLADKGVLNKLAHIVPALVVRVTAPVIFLDFEEALPHVIRFTDAYLIAVGLSVVLALTRVAEHWAHHSKAFKDQPLTSYFQLSRIILYIVAGILILSVLLGRSPIYFLGAFGTLSAILLLVFKDTILGLVASVQIAANDMVRIGDWVEMPKFNADGDVIAINLNTVKVQNFDRTITTIPTYFFITDSFKNWRGMQESGGRRIKRSIYVNVDTVKFVDPETREHYKKFYLIKDYVVQRQQEIEEFNRSYNIDTTELINGRRMTNLGVFRRYIDSYLRNHPRIHKEMTIMVRQLSIDDKGVPLEIYCFTNTTVWGDYETIQADIFDHLLAAAGFFDLEIFQQPSGRDISKGVQALIKSN